MLNPDTHEPVKTFDLLAYLDRIGLTEPPSATIEGLRAVHRAHRLAIPFENLDITLGRPISLDPDAIFDKLVTRRRGGYCFEQNALFGAALSALGFITRPLLARVWLMAQNIPPTTHRLEMLSFGDAHWIADAGFGGAFTPPMPLHEGEASPEPDGARHRLRQDQAHGWMLERLTCGTAMDDRIDASANWQAQYSFTLRDVHPNDLELCNHWTSTRPGTRFTSLMIASRITEDGFIAMTDNRLTFSTTNGATETILDTPETMRSALNERFGISLTEAEVARLPVFA